MQKMASLVLLLIAMALPAQTTRSATNAEAADAQSQTLSIYRKAIKSPFDANAVAAFEKALPHAGDYYVIEGDILVTKDELEEYLTRLVPSTVHDKSRELLVNTRPDGSLDYYRDPNQRTLSYSIDRRSFPTLQQYQIVVTTMSEATKSWVDACPECRISFQYNAAYDSDADITKSNFVVRYFDSHGAYVAASFFPSDPPMRRYLNVDPGYFTSPFDKIGVFRHELGHILGYRHEHIRDIPGCAYEDSSWKPLTSYDPHSVMHYFCGGGGSFSLELTAIDIQGHRKLYAPESVRTSGLQPDKNPPQQIATLIVRTQGGDVTNEAAEVLEILRQASLLPKTTVTLQKGDNLATVYMNSLGVPGVDTGLLSLARALNPQLRRDRGLSVGDTVIVPDIKFSTYSFSLIRNPASPSDKARQQAVTENWNYIRKPQTKSDAQADNSTFLGYELRLSMNIKDAQTMTQAINSQGKRNLLATYTDAATPPTFYSDIAPSQLIAKIRETPPVLHPNDEAYIGDLIRMPRKYTCQADGPGGAPDLVLIDQPIQHHPQLDDVVTDPTGPQATAPSTNPDGTVNLSYREFDPSVDHGTHLAGIIAAQDKGYGVTGVSPHSHLESWDWPALSIDVTRLGDSIQGLSEEDKRPLFVFASEWRLDQERLLSSPIEGSKSLWIVAAGEVKSGPPADITSDSKRFPMALGMKDSVIVVTSCDYCYDSTAGRVSPNSNFSTTRVVHVAAPGDKIPSTVREGSYGEAAGTSQATALTAGLVSAMVNCWPSYYQNETAKVKFRLQLTSYPGLRSDMDPTSDESRKVAAGVIDGKVALLDPRLAWLLAPSPGSITPEYKPIKAKSWCSQSIALQRDDNVPLDPVLTQYIRRIVKIGSEWIVYAHELPEGNNLRLDQIKRVGPGILDAAGLNAPLLNSDIGMLSLANITDVILPGPLPTTKCQVPQ